MAVSTLMAANSAPLPEVQFHAHDRFRLSAALLVGLAVAISIGLVEAG